MDSSSKYDFRKELIDTCWDVNADPYFLNEGMIQELIDTCWDVNKERTVYSEMEATELIDTCWDVNSYEMIASIDEYVRINRYMLGCK